MRIVIRFSIRARVLTVSKLYKSMRMFHGSRAGRSEQMSEWLG